MQGPVGQRPELSISAGGWAELGAGLFTGVREGGVHKMTHIYSSGA